MESTGTRHIPDSSLVTLIETATRFIMRIVTVVFVTTEWCLDLLFGCGGKSSWHLGSGFSCGSLRCSSFTCSFLYVFNFCVVADFEVGFAVVDVTLIGFGLVSCSLMILSGEFSCEHWMEFRLSFLLRLVSHIPILSLILIEIETLKRSWWLVNLHIHMSIWYSLYHIDVYLVDTVSGFYAGFFIGEKGNWKSDHFIFQFSDSLTWIFFFVDIKLDLIWIHHFTTWTICTLFWWSIINLVQSLALSCTLFMVEVGIAWPEFCQNDT